MPEGEGRLGRLRYRRFVVIAVMAPVLIAVAFAALIWRVITSPVAQFPSPTLTLGAFACSLFLSAIMLNLVAVAHVKSDLAGLFVWLVTWIYVGVVGALTFAAVGMRMIGTMH